MSAQAIQEAVVVGATRTLSGRARPDGRHANTHPVDLLSGTIAELLTRTGVDPTTVDDVIAGCVTQGAEQGGNIARSAALAAGLPVAVPGTTVDRQCGSSQQAVHFAAQAVMSGVQDVVIACGVESMSRVPMFSQYAGKDPYGPSVARRFPPHLIQQGLAGELMARDSGLSRADLDALAARSHERTAAAWEAGRFDRETIRHGKAIDETVRPGTTVEKLAGLSTVFAEKSAEERFGPIDWRLTAGNSSPLTDGAAAVLVMSRRAADAQGVRPRAGLRGLSVVGDDPVRMLGAVVPATRAALDSAGLTIGDVDVYEVNEAFAPVPLYWARELGADLDRVNPRGGAIALGHPLGASGARLLTTLLHTLEDEDRQFGLMTMCEAGGMANATILERF